MSDEAPRRLTLADAYRDAQHVIEQLTTRGASEAVAIVEFETTAKGELKPRVHLAAPVGCDLDALQKHVGALVTMAQAAYLDAQIVTPSADGEEVPF